MKVKFTASPTGLFNLAYHVGHVAEIKDQKLVKAMLEAKVCEVVAGKPSQKRKTATAKTNKETR